MTASSDEFRNVLRHFPAGVTIVTIKSPSNPSPHGLTVSAFASLSPVPPLIMVAIDHRGMGHQMLEEPGAVFAVNILAEDQQQLSNHFAWTKDEDRFVQGEWTTAVTGAPVLKNALAWLDCHIHDRITAGTHTIYIGQVQATGVPRPDEQPLVYWNRNYQQLQPRPTETE